MEPLVGKLCANLGGGNIIWLSLVLIFLLVASAFFSACETAYSTSNLIRMRNYADENYKGARKALHICENYDKTLTTILVGNNLVNIANTTIAAYIVTSLITSPVLSNILNTVVMTILILIFGEILPKSFAKLKPEIFAMRFSGLMNGVMIVLTPLTWFFMSIQKLALRRTKKGDKHAPTVTEDELESIIDTMEEEGVIDPNDASLIQGVLDLDDKTAYDIMTPRVDITAVEDTFTANEVYDVFVQSKYSRLPVYKEDIDHVVGIINLKDFIVEYVKNPQFNIKQVISQPVYINENLKVDDIIRRMQREKKHIALVLDEYGGTSGLVSFEDALEQMVGEIYDESDTEETSELITKIGDNKYLVDADISLEKLFEVLEIEKLPDTEYNSLAGFLYESITTVPEVNQEVVFKTIDEKVDKAGNYYDKTIKMIFKFVVVVRRRIKKVELTIE